MKRLALLVVATILAFSTAGTSADTSWYAGVAGGAASLRPETTNSPFKTDSSFSLGAGAFVGYDYSPRFSFEAGYNYLGAATLSGENGKSDIEYSALSVGALMYVYGDKIDIAERNGFVGYLRLGLNSMSNSTSIPLEQEDNVGLWAGAGVEWPISQNLNLRGELTSFDGDAQTARLAVLYRLRSSRQSASVSRAPQASVRVDSTPAQQKVEPIQEEPVQEEPIQEKPIQEEPVQQKSVQVQQQADPAPEPTVEQPARGTEQSLPGVAEISCVAPAAVEPIDAQGCALFGGLLQGVDFASGTANLTPEGSRALDRLGNNLLRYNTVVIEIQAHTESFGDRTRANDIAKQRTIAIARYLVGRGVPVSRLKARAFGHSRPLASDDTVEGRQQNNRIELRVLP